MMIDGQTRSPQPFALADQLYLTLSPDHNWIATANGSLPFIPGQLSLYSIDGSRALLQINDPYIVLRNSYWVDDEQLFISWANLEGDKIDGLLINPFTRPPQLSFPLTNVPRNTRFISFSPDMQFMVVYEEQYQRRVLYQVSEDRFFAIPTTENQGQRPFGAEWLNDGSLAYNLNTDFDEAMHAFNQEIFITEYPFNTLTQLTNLANEFGMVEFSGTGGLTFNWSPASNKVIFRMAVLHQPSDLLTAPINAELYIYDRSLDRTEQLCIFTDQNTYAGDFTGQHMFPGDIYWSPDSQYIAFVHNDVLFAYNVDASQVVRLAENAVDIYDWQ
jgi:hypothetical protein